MRRGSAFPVSIGLMVCGCLLWPAAFPARGQSEPTDAALRDRVLQLVDRLEAPKPEAREAALASLLKLGPKALPMLPDPATLPAGNRKDQIEKLRASLRNAEEEINPNASRVTLTGKGVRLSEAIQQLQKQTGNVITDLREQLGAEVTNPALDLEVHDKPFLEALDLVAKQAEVGIDFHTGDGSVGIMAGGAAAKPPIQYSGPFRIELKQIGQARDFGTGASTTNVQLEAAWEPRIRPMLLKLKAGGLKVVDDRGRPVKAQVEMESDEVAVRPENPVAELNLNLESPDRSAAKFKTLAVTAEVTVPAGIKVFKFPSLAQRDVTVTHGNVSVALQGTEVDEQVWKVGVELAFPGEGPAFESYRQGLFNNRIWLQRADGSRFEHNGGFSNTSNAGGKLGFEYLFVDAPGQPSDYQLVYEAPSKVIAVPLVFEFKDVPLP
jgi:hypothetical protein